MTKHLNILANVFGCIAGVLLVLSALAIPPQQAFAEPPGGLCDFETYKETGCPEGQVCVGGTWQNRACNGHAACQLTCTWLGGYATSGGCKNDPGKCDLCHCKAVPDPNPTRAECIK